MRTPLIQPYTKRAHNGNLDDKYSIGRQARPMIQYTEGCSGIFSCRTIPVMNGKMRRRKGARFKKVTNINMGLEDGANMLKIVTDPSVNLDSLISFHHGIFFYNKIILKYAYK